MLASHAAIGRRFARSLQNPTNALSGIQTGWLRPVASQRTRQSRPRPGGRFRRSRIPPVRQRTLGIGIAHDDRTGPFELGGNGQVAGDVRLPDAALAVQNHDGFHRIRRFRLV